LGSKVPGTFSWPLGSDPSAFARGQSLAVARNCPDQASPFRNEASDACWAAGALVSPGPRANLRNGSRFAGAGPAVPAQQQDRREDSAGRGAHPPCGPNLPCQEDSPYVLPAGAPPQIHLEGGPAPPPIPFSEISLKNTSKCDHVGSEMTVPSSAALRMRRSRDRRRQGDVIVSLDVGPKVTADLVALGWLRVSDRCNKDALTRCDAQHWRGRSSPASSRSTICRAIPAKLSGRCTFLDSP